MTRLLLILKQLLLPIDRQNNLGVLLLFHSFIL